MGTPLLKTVGVVSDCPNPTYKIPPYVLETVLYPILYIYMPIYRWLLLTVLGRGIGQSVPCGTVLSGGVPVPPP